MFILQPDMRGLEWETRIFFQKAHYLYTLINDQAGNEAASYHRSPTSAPNQSSRDQKPQQRPVQQQLNSSAQLPSAFKAVREEVRTKGEPREARVWPSHLAFFCSVCLPQLDLRGLQRVSVSHQLELRHSNMRPVACLLIRVVFLHLSSLFLTQQRDYGLILPQMIDFGVHVLGECERHCRLVSESSILRTDIGVEFLYCKGGQSEEDLKKERKRPDQWQLTGEGFIIRCFLNEVTSSLDINCQSQQNKQVCLHSLAHSSRRSLTFFSAAYCLYV